MSMSTATVPTGTSSTLHDDDPLTFWEMVHDIMKTWREEGHDEHPNMPGMPLHPELVFRESGEWRGWSDFLGASSSAENDQRDEVENVAFLEWEQEVRG